MQQGGPVPRPAAYGSYAPGTAPPGQYPPSNGGPAPTMPGPPGAQAPHFPTPHAPAGPPGAPAFPGAARPQTPAAPLHSQMQGLSLGGGAPQVAPAARPMGLTPANPGMPARPLSSPSPGASQGPGLTYTPSAGQPGVPGGLARPMTGPPGPVMGGAPIMGGGPTPPQTPGARPGAPPPSMGPPNGLPGQMPAGLAPRMPAGGLHLPAQMGGGGGSSGSPSLAGGPPRMGPPPGAASVPLMAGPGAASSPGRVGGPGGMMPGAGAPQMPGAPTMMGAGPPMMGAGPQMMNPGSQMMGAGPQMMSAGPPMMGAGPQMMNPGPQMMPGGPQPPMGGMMPPPSGISVPLMPSGPPSSAATPRPGGSLARPPPPPLASPPGEGTLPGIGANESVSVSLMPATGATGASAAASFPRPAGAALEPSTSPPQPYSAYNCHPAFVRFATQAVPNAQSLRARWHLPLGALVQPMAEAGGPVPVIDMGSTGIVRCVRCRTYVNPFVSWLDGGRSFGCNVCGVVNQTPVEYFCALDSAGQRLDVQDRPELRAGCVEYVAPAEYMVRAPVPPTYVFVLDVSFAAASTGFLQTACEAIRAALPNLPGDDRTQVAVITFDAAVHFYQARPEGRPASMHVVADVDELFVPLPDDLLCNRRECAQGLDALLEGLPRSFAGAQGVASATGPALQAAFLVAAHVGGKLLLFQAAAPSVGIGRVRARDDPALQGTDREHTLRAPDDPFYKRFAAECSRSHLCVDVFAGGATAMDLASLGAMPKYLGGQLYYYPAFERARDGAKLRAEAERNLLRETGWEAVMRIRCSKGLRVPSFYGHFYIRTSDLLSLPAVDADKAFGVEMVHEEAVLQGPTAYLQSALLYTASNGERRIRVHTCALPVVSELADLYRAADAGACATLLAKACVERSYVERLEVVRVGAHHRALMALREWRNVLLQRGGPGAAGAQGAQAAMLLPARLAALPALVLGLLKCAALRGGVRDVHTDERMAVGHRLVTGGVPDVLRVLYPRVYALLDDETWTPQSPPWTVPAGAAYCNPAGAYLVDAGRVLVLWLGAALAPPALAGLLGAQAAQLAQQDPRAAVALELDPAASDLAAKIRALADGLAGRAEIWPRLFVVRQGSPAEAHVGPLFVEDALPAAGAPAFFEYMQMLQKDVLGK